MDASGKILGYFIEEAKEHLTTLENGIVDLRAVMTDEERVNELFRAAHSVKGGAAMLGFSSIQKTSHKLEDCFKILQEHPVKVDQKLEMLFFKVYDTLKELIEQLQGPFGLREEEADKLVLEAEPNFAELQDYLKALLDNSATVPQPAVVPMAKEAVVTSQPSPSVASKTGTNIAAKMTGILKQMLEIFKQKETATNRQQLIDCCKTLLQLGKDVEPWKILIQTTYKAISNPQNLYRNLAPVVIKEIKQASDLLVAGKAAEIIPSPSLKQLAGITTAEAVKTTPTDKPKQITITVEPKEAAKALLQAFNKQQLLQLIQYLQRATR